MKSILSVLISLISSYAIAQTISYSPYSVYGIGVLKERTSMHNRALGETGIGVREDAYVNNLNPASYPAVSNGTQITELGLFYESNRLSNGQSTSTSSGGSLTSLTFWFRFSKRWASTIGLSPFSTIKYDINALRTGTEGEQSLIRYEGSGGLTEFRFGNGFQLTKNLSIGINTSYIFGNITKNETILAGQASGIAFENKTYLNRPTADIGLQYSFFLPKNRMLVIGATAADKLRLNTSQKIRVYEMNGSDSLYADELSPSDYVLPSRLGAGISLSTPRHLVAGDINFKKWSTARLDRDLILTNTYRASLAYEYKGNPKSDSYWDYITLRAGVNFQNNYFILKNTPFDQWGLTLGTGLPLPGNHGMLSLTYNYSRVGTTTKQLIEQRAQIFVLDIVCRDLWGGRRKFH